MISAPKMGAIPINKIIICMELLRKVVLFRKMKREEKGSDMNQNTEKVQSICVWSEWWELGCNRGKILGAEAGKGGCGQWNGLGCCVEVSGLYLVN